jgi:hypothetical protein
LSAPAIDPTTAPPTAEPSGIDFPAGPTYPDLLGGGTDGISWVRYKVWSADWYVRTLESLEHRLADFDRYVGIEMAIDGALGALSGAFDASLALLIENAEEQLKVPEVERTRAHEYKWWKFKKLANDEGLSGWSTIPQLIVDIEAALEGANGPEPTGWLAVLRRLRNRSLHQQSLPRTWEIEGAAGSTAVRVTDFAGGEVTYLKASCDQVSDLTERMISLANSLGWIGPLTPLQRTRWDHPKAAVNDGH